MFSVDNFEKRRTSGEKLLSPFHHSKHKLTSSPPGLPRFFIFIERDRLSLFIRPAQRDRCSLLCGRAITKTLLVLSDWNSREGCPAVSLIIFLLLHDWPSWPISIGWPSAKTWTRRIHIEGYISKTTMWSMSCPKVLYNYLRLVKVLTRGSFPSRNIRWWGEIRRILCVERNSSN